MSFGGNFNNLNEQTLAQMLGQYGQLQTQQGDQAAATQTADQGTIAAAMNQLQLLEGQTPQQQKKSVNFGLMDFIKTGPNGLANQSPSSTGLVSILG